MNSTGMKKRGRRMIWEIIFFLTVLALPVLAQEPAVPTAETPAVTGVKSASQPKRLKDYNLPGFDTKVSLQSLRPWDIVELIEFLAYKGGLNNIVIGKGVSGQTQKLKFEDVTVADALEVVLSMNNLAYKVEGGILTVMTDEEYRRQFGASFYNQRQVSMETLNYASPERMAAVLAPLKSEIGTIVTDKVGSKLILIDTPEKIAEMRSIIQKSDVPTETRVFALQYGNVEEVAPEVTAMLTPELGRVSVDKRTKNLVVTDLPEKMEKIAKVVQVFDTRPKQVFIEAKIVQVSLGDAYKLGINWNHVFQLVSPRMNLGVTVRPPLQSEEGITPPGGGFGSLSVMTVVGGSDLTVLLDALKTIGDTKILSNPHIAVLDGQEAVVKSVTDQPYAEAQLESGTTNVVGETVKFVEVGVTLAVKPRINEDRMISMSVKPEVSSVLGNYQAYRQVPIVRRSYAETSVMIKDGETIIIAGMIEQSATSKENSVPFLGRIPLFGLLFRSKSQVVAANETVVFLTPRVITGEEPFLLLRDMKKRPKPLRSRIQE
ncbi:MAG: secretin N-terminal domain-containing protein [Kiritimatiellia bacterium]